MASRLTDLMLGEVETPESGPNAKWREAGKRAVVALDIPEPDFDPKYCLSQLSSSMLFAKPCAIERRLVDARQRSYRRVVLSAIPT